jgi:hypothetical protein
VNQPAEGCSGPVIAFNSMFFGCTGAAKLGTQAVGRRGTPAAAGYVTKAPLNPSGATSLEQAACNLKRAADWMQWHAFFFAALAVVRGTSSCRLKDKGLVPTVRLPPSFSMHV